MLFILIWWAGHAIMCIHHARRQSTLQLLSSGWARIDPETFTSRWMSWWKKKKNWLLHLHAKGLSHSWFASPWVLALTRSVFDTSLWFCDFYGWIHKKRKQLEVVDAIKGNNKKILWSIFYTEFLLLANRVYSIANLFLIERQRVTQQVWKWQRPGAWYQQW